MRGEEARLGDSLESKEYCLYIRVVCDAHMHTSRRFMECVHVWVQQHVRDKLDTYIHMHTPTHASKTLTAWVKVVRIGGGESSSASSYESLYTCACVFSRGMGMPEERGL